MELFRCNSGPWEPVARADLETHCCQCLSPCSDSRGDWDKIFAAAHHLPPPSHWNRPSLIPKPLARFNIGGMGGGPLLSPCSERG